MQRKSLKKLASLGEFNGELGDLKIEVSFDKKKRPLPLAIKGLA
jgi:molecular chaperone HtpG